MEKNPLEQQQSKIDALREEMKGKLAQLFDDKEKRGDRIDSFILQLGDFEKAGLVFNKEEIIKGLNESLETQDREAFIIILLRVLEPIMALKFAQPKIFEKIERERTVNAPGNSRLSEVLYVNFEDAERADIHLAPASELIKEAGIKEFKKDVERGLIKLAEIIKSKENVEEIWATSWIVAKNPLLFKRMGFTVSGEIPKDERHAYENRPIAEAYINREDFLKKYGNK